MTPKEKAKDLIDKYVGFELNPYNDPEMRLTLFKAKKNALICIDELLEQISLPEDDWFEERKEYLLMVKEELHRL